MIPCILHPRGEAKRLAGSTDAAKGLCDLRVGIVTVAHGDRDRASLDHLGAQSSAAAVRWR